MAHDPDFESIIQDSLSGAVGTAPRPGLCAGVFRMVAKDFSFGRSKQKQTPQIDFQCRVLGAVDGKKADIEALGDLGEKVEEVTFYFTPNSLFRLDDFLSLFDGTKGLPRKEAITKVIGKPFLAHYQPEEIERDGRKTGEFAYRAKSFARDSK